MPASPQSTPNPDGITLEPSHKEPLKVVIFTGTRAESGLLSPIAQACLEHPQINPSWLVSGLHLLADRGATAQALRDGEIPVCAEVPFFERHQDHGISTADSADSASKPTSEIMLPLAHDMGTGIAKLSEALASLKPDWLVLLGDRVETFAAASAAYVLGIPICHLHGGDRIDSGHMDEGFRHAITRFAHLHCPASDASAERLRKFGEEDWRITMIGAPGLDRLAALKAQVAGREREVLSELGVPRDREVLLVIFHPVSRERDDMQRQCDELMAALDARPEHKLAVLPNNDPGAEPILAALDARASQADWSVAPNLNGEQYASALASARAFVGNSSSGVIEAPLFALPFVHIGSRNTGREHAGHVDFIEADRAAIAASITRAVTPEEHARIAALRNPYGAGHAGALCAKLLARFAKHPMLTRKVLSY